MARKIPADRFERLIKAATAVFIRNGLRRTQMSDVATELGVSAGTLYRYVDSKEALFDAAVRFCDKPPEELPAISELPWPTPGEGETAAYLLERLDSETRDQQLRPARISRNPDVAAELRAICRELYRMLQGNKVLVKLVDRCAGDRPDLSEVWFYLGRLFQAGMLEDYLVLQQGNPGLRQLPAPSVAARLILETLAFWALHRHWDPSPQRFDEAELEEQVLDLVLHGVVREADRS